MRKIYLFLLLIIFARHSGIGQTVNYSALLDNSTFNRSLNITLPVGSVNGQAGVSSVGAATYSIPITIPPGTNGIVPSVSLDYNSMRGTGLLGVGWGINGLSFISRASGTAYHDGSAKPVELAVNDRLVLDGARMILKIGTYGTDGSTYGTETENFSTITAKGTAGNGPQWFEVTTKEGVVMEYGRVPNSTVFKPSGGTVLIWGINKVLYPDGNYITFTYSSDSQAVRIAEINYTGNKNAVPELLPYNKIKFEYKARIDNNAAYEADLAVGSFQLLDKITVTTESESQTVAVYQLNYAHDDINSYLKEVIQKGSDGSTSLNSTIFKYGQTPTQFTAGSSSVVQNVMGEEFVLDYNGNGVSDVLSTERVVVNQNNVNYAYHKSFTLYARDNPSQDNSYGVDAVYTLPANSFIVQQKKIFETNNFLSNDYTGDGADDILTARTNFVGSQRMLSSLMLYKPMKNPAYPGSGFPYKIDSLDMGSGARIHPSGNFIFSGDFNGDGLQDVLTTLGIGTANTNYGVQLNSAVYGSSMSFFVVDVVTTGTAFFPVTAWAASDQVHILDFNGDGKSDIMLIKDNNCEIFTIDGSLTNAPLARRIYFSSSAFAKTDLIYFGDFNGDRKTDMLVRKSLTDNNAPWARILSTGTDLSGEVFTFTKIPSVTGIDSDEHLTIGDFNGDGRSDVYHGWRITTSSANLDVYYSRGLDFKFIRSPYSVYIGPVPALIGDLNGDGRSDIINRKCYCEPFDIFYFKKEGKENLIEKIANGYNHVTEWNHKKLTDGGTFYARGNLTAFPLNTVQLPFYTVSDFKSQNGIGGVSTMQYSYEGAKLHKSGKGFLGFTKVTENNLAMGMKTVSENQFNTTFYTAIPYRTSTYLASNNATYLTQTTLTNDVVALTGSRFWLKNTKTDVDNAFEGRSFITDNTYDANGNITVSTVTKKGGGNTVESATTTTTYGAFVTGIPNQPTSLTVSNTRGGQTSSVTTTFGYNGLGQRTSKTDFSGLPKSVASTYTYNTFGNVTSTAVTPSGMPARGTSNTYDTKGRFSLTGTNVLTQVSTTTYDPKWGTQLTTTNVDGLMTTSIEYDFFGRIKKTNFPEGYSVNQSYGWEVSGNSVWYDLISHPGQPDVKTWHDVLGRVTKTETEGFQSEAIIQETGYDARGNLATSAQPHKATESALITTTTFDEYNRSVSSGNSIFGTTSTSYSYNAGNLNTTTTNAAGQISSQVTDAAGRTVTATDHYGNTLSYTYNGQGNLLTVNAGNPTIITNEYDAYGKQTKLIDQNAGTTTYAFDALGNQVSMVNANGDTHSTAFDVMGRIISRTGPEGTTSYEFYPSNSGVATNQPKKITGFAGNLEEFTYDNFGRLASVKETVDSDPHNTSYEYDIYGANTSILYASGFRTRQLFDANGYLLTIKNNDNTVTLYSNTGMNALGQNTGYTLGGNQNVIRAYNRGIPTLYLAAGIQNLEFGWNYNNRNLMQRKDNIKGKIEDFTYDNLNRLLTATITSLPVQTMTYANSGNISSKTDVGAYSYHATKQNALIGVTNPVPTIPLMQQDVKYNSFMQPESIKESNSSSVPYELTYTYNAAYDRIKGVLKQNGSVINIRYYLGGFEKDVTGSSTKYIHHVTGPAGLVAIVVREGGNDTYNYVYSDHLGSILTLTNSSGSVVAEQNFDAWGRRRNPTTWVSLLPTAATGLPVSHAWLRRGYTGHEHLDNFGLINMNGRMYDPVVARVLSPDNHVQNSLGTQDYNRYSYAKNNPLLYNDPDGQFVVEAIVLGAMIGSFVGMIQASRNGQHELSGAWKGALVGGLGGLAGAFAPIGILPGLGYGAATGAATGGLNAALFGNNIGRSALTGAVLGGIAGGVFGGIEARSLGADIWTGHRPTHYMLSDESTVAGTIPAPYTDEYLSQLKAANYSDIKGVQWMSKNYMPENFKMVNGEFITPKGERALAATQPRIWAHGNTSRILFAKAAFASREQLAETMAHELGHVIHNSMSLTDFANQPTSNAVDYLETEGHVAIRKMTNALVDLNKWNGIVPTVDVRFHQAFPNLYDPIQTLIRKICFP